MGGGGISIQLSINTTLKDRLLVFQISGSVIIGVNKTFRVEYTAVVLHYHCMLVNQLRTEINF